MLGTTRKAQALLPATPANLCRLSWLPQWHLQGLHKQGRAAIITASMHSLQQLLCQAPASLAAAPASVLEATAVAAVAAAACNACASSLGYVPSELLQATAAALEALREELDSFQVAAQAAAAGALVSLLPRI